MLMFRFAHPYAPRPLIDKIEPQSVSYSCGGFVYFFPVVPAILVLCVWGPFYFRISVCTAMSALCLKPSTFSRVQHSPGHAPYPDRREVLQHPATWPIDLSSIFRGSELLTLQGSPLLHWRSWLDYNFTI